MIDELIGWIAKISNPPHAHLFARFSLEHSETTRAGMSYVLHKNDPLSSLMAEEQKKPAQKIGYYIRRKKSQNRFHKIRNLQRYKVMMQTQFVFKDNLLERFGGAAAFKFLIIAYCERILSDDELDRLFGNFTLNGLIPIQTDLLLAAFVDTMSTSDELADLQGRVTLSHYRLFEMGLNESHFDRLQEHFTSSLYDCWLEDDVVELSKKHFKSVRVVFEENRKDHLREAIHQQVDEDLLSLSMREALDLRETKEIFDKLYKWDKTKSNFQRVPKISRVPFWRPKVRQAPASTTKRHGI